MSEIRFTVYAHPEPQGSSKAFRHSKTNRIIVNSDNPQVKPYRHIVTQLCCEQISKLNASLPWADKKIPVSIGFRFYLQKPSSVPKKRTEPVVKPDLDKLIRSTTDALTGVLYHDDAQIVEYFEVRKLYGTPERVEIVCRQNETEPLPLPCEEKL